MSRTVFSAVAVVLLLATGLSEAQSSRSTIVVKVCNSTGRSCIDNCTSYVVQPKQCFTDVPEHSMEFACNPYPACIDGTEYIENSKCDGNFSTDVTEPCNRCIDGAYTHCNSSSNTVTHYRCFEMDRECTNLTRCEKVFTAAMGKCTSVDLGFFNMSIQLAAARARCTMVKVDEYFNSKCETRTNPPTFQEKPQLKETFPPFTFAPGHRNHHFHHWTLAPGTHHWTEAPGAHHWAEHESFMVGSGKCLREGRDHVMLTCKASGAAADNLPVATPEILALVRAHVAKHKAQRDGPATILRNALRP